jgi:ankyrin repeat protein
MEMVPLLGENNDLDWIGKFVRIGEFDGEAFAYDCGNIGFIVKDGICQPEVVYLDHECESDQDVIKQYAQVVSNDICEFLLRVLHGQDAQLIKDSDDEQNLTTAAYNGDLERVRELLNDGADIEAETGEDETDEAAETALMQASWPGRIEVVKLLLERGAKVDAQDEDGDTSLMKAAYHGRLEVVRLLLEHGAAVNHRDDAGDTALIWAALQQHTDLVQLLLEHGADVSIKNKQKDSPFHYEKRGD